MTSIDVNDTVWVRLTPAGLAHIQASRRYIPEPVDGWHGFQLWGLMNAFGPMLARPGVAIPFEGNLIHFEKPE